ncbi:MAG: TasA family protein, partial [Firmicutes bacterium]|nr:TasA family protein [Bacillota bacterium]
MTNTKATKRALLLSVMAMLVCVAMLVGTTFAWFTDSASTAVNKIQAGKLDVALEMYDGTNWVSAEGKVLQFKVNGAIPAEGTQILWEPGCTYE